MLKILNVNSLLFFFFKAGVYQKKLLKKLFSTYDTTERPVTHEHDNLDVSIGLSIQQIVDIDEKKQTITLMIENFTRLCLE